MPLDTAAQTTLTVIAVVLSIQTTAIVVAIIGAAIELRRMREKLDRTSRELTQQLSEVIEPVRDAADAMARASDHASQAFGRVDRLAGTVGTVVSAPFSVAALVTGGVTALARVIMVRRARRHAAAAAGSGTHASGVVR